MTAVAECVATERIFGAKTEGLGSDFYASIFTVDGTKSVVLFRNNTLTWSDYISPRNFTGMEDVEGRRGGVHTLHMRDVCIVEAKGSRAFALHCLVVQEGAAKKARIYKRVELSFIGHYGKFAAPEKTSPEKPVSGWVQMITEAVRSVNGDPRTRKPVLGLVNPFSGFKKGPTIWNEHICPLFTAAGLEFETVVTEHAHHAFELVHEMDMSKYSAILPVGGDGILSEVINGIMSRDDWRECISIPVAPVAAGTGNATAHTLYFSTLPECIACHVVKDFTIPVDIFLSSQPSIQRYMWGVLDISHGIIAEADFGSEKIRWAGSARPTIWAIYRIMCGTKYRCKLTYLPTNIPRQGWYGQECGRNCRICRNAMRHEDQDYLPDVDIVSVTDNVAEEAPFEDTETSSTTTSEVSEEQEREERPPKTCEELMEEQKHGAPFTTNMCVAEDWTGDVPSQFASLFEHYQHYIVGQPVPEGWVSKPNLSVCFNCFQKLPYLMPGMYVAPFAHLADGCMDVCYLGSEHFSRPLFIKCFLNFDSGKHVERAQISYFKVRSFTLEPIDEGDYVGVDGERIPVTPIHVHIAQGLMNFLVYQ